MTGPFGAQQDDEMIVIDGLDEVDDNPFYVPSGDYLLQVTDLENGMSRNDDPMLVFTFTVVKPVGNGATKDGVGKDLKVWNVKSKAAMWRLKKTLAGLGMNVNVKTLKIKFSELLNKKCIGTIVDDKYDGRTVSKVKEIRPVGAK